MRTIEIQGSFGLENLKIVERPTPEPAAHQVLVKVSAVSLNYRDLLMVRGLYNPRQPLPLVPLSDGVGEVVAVGAKVKSVKLGQRVASVFAQGWTSGVPTKAKLNTTLGGPLDGMLAEYCLLDEAGVVVVPEHLTHDEAATLPCAAVTAWSALVEQGNLRAGQCVVLQGTGGVSIFALQFAKMLGARVIITSGSDEKLQKAKLLGADELINYRTTPDWEKIVREKTNGVGADHIVEVGGAGTFARSVRAVKVGGQISVIGVLSGASTDVNLLPILMQNIRVQGVIVGSKETFESMNAAISFHKLKPVVDRVFSFENTVSALQYMAQGAHFGKICINVGGQS